MLVAVGLMGWGAAAAQARTFYTPPSHLARYRVGQLISFSRAPSSVPQLRRAGRVLRFMYRSESATGAPRAETGVLVVPRGKAPRGGWPVVAWDHGTTGVGPGCAPSRMANLSSPSYAAFVAALARAGYAVVAPDYEGLGPLGETSPYAELASEGRSTIDAVRAAHGIVDGLTRRWVVIGHSQGGQAALGTAQLAGTRAPTYPLIGTVPMAPASHLGKALDILRAMKPPKLNTLPEIAYLLLSAQVSDPSFDPSRVASAGMAAGLSHARRGCFDAVQAWYAKHRPARMFKRNWRSSQALQLFVSRNAPGKILLSGPVLLAQGEADHVVAPQLTAELDRNMCALGQNVDFKTYSGVGHDALVPRATRDVLAWIAARFAGRPAASNCPAHATGLDPGAPPGAGRAQSSSTSSAAPAQVHPQPRAQAQARGFYSPPTGLAHYPVGTTIRSQPAPRVEPAVRRAGRMLRFMYRSESETGAPRAETGVIIVPRGRAPRGGWPVIAWDHGTTGIGPACAPSRTPLLGDHESDYAGYLAPFAAHGYVVVAPDYEGLGPNGEISPFAELVSEGRSTVDAVRAARGVVAHLSRRWVVLGHSQGGQAALGTAQVAATRAPRLPLIGTVAMAPASHFAEALDILGNKVPPDPATLPEAVYLLLSAHLTDALFDPAGIVGPGVAAGFKLAHTGCYAKVYAFYQQHPPTRLFRGDWRDSQPLRLFASRNDPGTQLVPGPMMLDQGTADTTIPPALTAELDRKYCSLGQSVDFRRFRGVSHNGIPAASQRKVLAWIGNRFAGSPAISNCRGTAPRSSPRSATL